MFDPGKTSAEQLVSEFADMKKENPSKCRYLLTLISEKTDNEAAGGQDLDTSSDVAPPLPPGSPDFGSSTNADSNAAVDLAPPGPSGGDFEVLLEAPAE